MSGHVFHVLNRAARRARVFATASDYNAFEEVLEETTLMHWDHIAVFAYCLMPNHWHLIASSSEAGALSAFMHRLTATHARRWHCAKGTEGEGAVYQGRFTAVPIQCDRHFLIACRYVERNALRSAMVRRAEDWPWCSLSRQIHGEASWLAGWPVERPPEWVREVNTHQTASELEALRRATRLGQPFGDEQWRKTILRPPESEAGP